MYESKQWTTEQVTYGIAAYSVSPRHDGSAGPAAGGAAGKGTEGGEGAIAQHLATALPADREKRNHEDQAPPTGPPPGPLASADKVTTFASSSMQSKCFKTKT